MTHVTVYVICIYNYTSMCIIPTCICIIYILMLCVPFLEEGQHFGSAASVTAG